LGTEKKISRKLVRQGAAVAVGGNPLALTPGKDRRIPLGPVKLNFGQTAEKKGFANNHYTATPAFSWEEIENLGDLKR
jgi:hypothetical protein